MRDFDRVEVPQAFSSEVSILAIAVLAVSGIPRFEFQRARAVDSFCQKLRIDILTDLLGDSRLKCCKSAILRLMRSYGPTIARMA